MQPVFALALSAMHQDMERMDTIAANLANVSTPGYKREVAAARPFTEALDDAAQAAPGAPGATAAAGGVLSPMLMMLDGRPGTVKSTGEPLDLALGGEGYFEVTTDQGLAYTRRGDFKVDAQGRLVTSQGHPVMGRAGEIYLSTATPAIDQDGNVTEPDAAPGSPAAVAGHPLAQVKVVHFDEGRQLRPIGNGLYAPGSGLAVQADGHVQLRQGSLENSNVDSMHEMVDLMQTMRHFESLQKAAQGYDEMTATAIHKLGDLA